MSCKTAVLIFVIPIVFACLPGNALAQYYVGLAPMDARPAEAGEKLEADLYKEVLSISQDKYRINRVETIFKLVPGMARWYSEEGWQTDFQNYAEPYKEYILQGEQLDQPGPSMSMYKHNGSPIYICVGGYYFDGGEWQGVEEPKLITFIVKDGEVTVLDCFIPDGYSWHDVFAVDVNRDGLLEIIAGFSFGASFGGGIHVVTVGSDGKLTPLGADHENEGQIGSANGLFAVHDYNQDRVWEIESRFGYYPAPAGDAVYLRLLYRFDQESGKWVDVTTNFPQEIGQQLAFLTELNDRAQALLALIAQHGSDDGIEYSCLIDGEQYSLDLITDTRYIKDLPLLVADWQAGRRHEFQLENP